jgi:hypothetical protein
LDHGNEEKDETMQEQDSSTQKKAGNKIDVDSDGTGIDYCA